MKGSVGRIFKNGNRAAAAIKLRWIIGERRDIIRRTVHRAGFGIGQNEAVEARKGEKRKMPFEYGFYELTLIFLFWGVVGWIIEAIDMRIEAGEFQNRGFLHMPLCPIYGIGMAAGSVVLNDVRNSYLILFVFGVIFCSVVEYIVGGILEKLFRSKWWDYSHMRYNIKGRVCLRNAVLFGFGAILVFHFVEPMVEKVILRIPTEVRMAVTVIFSIVFIIDLVASAKRAWAYRDIHEGDEPRLLFKAHR